MTTILLREGARFSLEELRGRLGGQGAIQALVRCGVLRRSAPANRRERFEQLALETPDDENPEEEYASPFVGIALLDDVVIQVYPKFYSTPPSRPRFKTILDVIQKAGPMLEAIPDHQTAGGAFLGRLPLMALLLRDYFKNGLYENRSSAFTENGQGEIDWGRTTESTTPWIQGGAPHYLDVVTRRTIRNETNVVRRLHAAVLTRISRELSGALLLDLFGFEDVVASSEEISDIGSENFLQYHLDRERRSQFDTGKLRLIELLRQYLFDSKPPRGGSNVHTFGTFNFNLIWQCVCASLLENRSDSLGRFIPRPRWVPDQGEATSVETLLPDILATIQDDDGANLLILDAKYYDISFSDGHLSGNPGLQDVVKQFVYQMAFEPSTDSRHWKSITNAFLMPGENSNVERLGCVRFPVFGDRRIEVVRLPADALFHQYVAREPFDLPLLFGKLRGGRSH